MALRPDDKAGPLGANPTVVTSGAPVPGAAMTPAEKARLSPMAPGGAYEQMAAAGPSQSVGSLLDVRSSDQLNDIARQEIEAEIAGQVAPLEAELGTVGRRETSALGNLDTMFGSLLPFVSGAAQHVSESWDQAEKAQQSIFSAAQQRMTQLRQDRAQEAQALAQRMGGPVAIGEFTEGVTGAEESLIRGNATQGLNTLANAQAGVQLANAFAGQVFPLVRTEETARARQYYEDQKKELEQQIASLKATKTSKINARANELLVQERQFALQKTDQEIAKLKAKQDQANATRTLKNDDRRLALEKQKADRDWQATLSTLANDRARVTLATKEFGLSQAAVTGKYAGKPTLAAKQLTAEEKRQAAALDMSDREYLLSKQKLTADTANANKRLALSEKAAWGQYLDNALTPQPGKSVTYSQAVPVPAQAALMGKVKDAFVDTRSPTGYSRIIKITQPQTGTVPITDPNDLVDYLVSHNVPKATAIAMVKARLAIPNWKYGQQDPNRKIPKPKKKAAKKPTTTVNAGPPAPGKTTAGPFP